MREPSQSLHFPVGMVSKVWFRPPDHRNTTRPTYRSAEVWIGAELSMSVCAAYNEFSHRDGSGVLCFLVSSSHISQTPKDLPQSLRLSSTYLRPLISITHPFPGETDSWQRLGLKEVIRRKLTTFSDEKG